MGRYTIPFGVLSPKGYVLIILIGLYLGIGSAQEVRVCEASTCMAPNCSCAGRFTPGGLEVSTTPQIVLLTFSGPLDPSASESLQGLLRKDQRKRANPNGCPIGVTLFVQHIRTNYCMVADFWREGHEIASHSITHKEPAKFWEDATYEEYEQEAWGQRRMLSALGGIDKNTILGYRAPFLRPGGDVHFQVLRDQAFAYDSSFQTALEPGADPYWPFTLDFPNQVPCIVGSCPVESYPGLWELPIQPPVDKDGVLCPFIDSCAAKLTTEDEIHAFLTAYFNRSYQNNRAPLLLNLRKAWFRNNTNKEAMERFLNELEGVSDVWFITASQLIQWLINPTPLQSINTFQPWKCDKERNSSSCSKDVLLPGRNRTKKPGFEPYKIKNITDYFGNRQGGKTLLFWYSVFFAISFFYLTAFVG